MEKSFKSRKIFLVRKPLTHTVRAMNEIEIITDRASDGTYSYQFTLNGSEYSDRDFTSREAALSDARSVARCAFRKEAA